MVRACSTGSSLPEPPGQGLSTRSGSSGMHGHRVSGTCRPGWRSPVSEYWRNLLCIPRPPLPVRRPDCVPSAVTTSWFSANTLSSMFRVQWLHGMHVDNPRRNPLALEDVGGADPLQRGAIRLDTNATSLPVRYSMALPIWKSKSSGYITGYPGPPVSRT